MAGARPRATDDDDRDSDSDSDSDDDDEQEGDDFALSAADLRQIANVKDQVPSLEQLRAHLPYISLHLPTSPHISQVPSLEQLRAHLPYTSLYLPISPRCPR